MAEVAVRKTKYWTWLAGATLVTLLAILICTCEVSDDESELPYNQDGDDDDTSSDDSCPISPDGLTELPFVANCFDPLAEDNVVTVESVRGTGLTLVNGERFVVTGTFDFSRFGNGKVEPIITCPSGSAYGKCSYPYSESSGSFEVRVQVADCDVVDKPNEISLNVWDLEAAEGGVMCVITLGEDVPVDDDTTDDDTADDDTADDDTIDDDTTDDDTADDDTTDDDTADDDTAC